MNHFKLMLSIISVLFFCACENNTSGRSMDKRSPRLRCKRIQPKSMKAIPLPLKGGKMWIFTRRFRVS